ncbi:hypothetical protein ACFL4Z_04350, partial [candidate division KSB1 bacterium]
MKNKSLTDAGDKGFLLIISLIGLLLIKIISGFIPENVFWGMDYWRYIPYGFFFIILFIIFYTALVLFGGNRISGFWNGIKNFILKKPRIWISSIIAVISVLIFYLFRVKLFLLGDGYIVTRVITSDNLRLFIYKEPLDVLLHSFLYKSLFPIFSLDV